MKELLEKYENKEPEIVFNWKDPETEAEPSEPPKQFTGTETISSTNSEGLPISN